MGLTTGLDNVERRKILPLQGLELRPLCRPARSQSLFRLSYPGPFLICGRSFVLEFGGEHRKTTDNSVWKADFGRRFELKAS
jgi:hypothetical protein